MATTDELNITDRVITTIIIGTMAIDEDITIIMAMDFSFATVGQASVSALGFRDFLRELEAIKADNSRAIKLGK